MEAPIQKEPNLDKDLPDELGLDDMRDNDEFVTNPDLYKTFAEMRKEDGNKSSR